MKYEISKLNNESTFTNSSNWNSIIVLLDSNNNIVYQTINSSEMTLKEILERFYKTTTNIRHKYRDMTLEELMSNLDITYLLVS